VSIIKLQKISNLRYLGRQYIKKGIRIVILHKKSNALEPRDFTWLYAPYRYVEKCIIRPYTILHLKTHFSASKTLHGIVVVALNTTSIQGSFSLALQNFISRQSMFLNAK